MSEPLSQAQVEAEIMRLSGLAEKATHEIAKRARAAAEADVAWKVGYAKAFLLADGTGPARDAQATVECADEYAAKKSSEAVLMSAQEAGRNYRAQLDALRSINANHRALVTG
jgi:hypothetical protein